MRAELATDGTLLFWCPGCEEAHGIPVDGSRGWEWNGSLESPTVKPSILVRSTRCGPDKVSPLDYDGPYPCDTHEHICHSFVTDGKIQFLNDCTHPLKGQTVDLPEWGEPNP